MISIIILAENLIHLLVISGIELAGGTYRVKWFIKASGVSKRLPRKIAASRLCIGR